MLSLSRGGMSAAQAGGYFTREDYYLRGQESSQWVGKEAAELGLKGEVGEEAFKNLAAGRNPSGTAQLVTPKIKKNAAGDIIENHRAGNDLTFSAPKSVSVAFAAGNSEVRAIWNRAVLDTMHYVERHYSHYRTPEGLVAAGSLAAAKFDHVTSRALDPEVHSHVFLLNLVRDQKGRWLANEPKAIYQDKLSIGLLTRQQAIHLYRQAGYEIEYTDRDQLLFEIKGVLPAELEVFSNRSRAIAEEVARWRKEGRFPGVLEGTLKAMAALDSRDPKRDVSRADVRRVWNGGFAAAGTTPEAVLGRVAVAKMIQSMPPTCLFPSERELDHQPSSRNPEEVLRDAARLITEKEVVFDRGQLLSAAAKISGGDHDINDLDHALDGDRFFHSLGRETLGWQAGKEFLTTRDMRELELQNLARLKALETFHSCTSTAEIEAYLKGLGGAGEEQLTAEESPYMAAYFAGANAASECRPVELTPGQREHLVNEVAGGKGFAVTQGDPGTGKTFASGIIESFNAEVLNPSGRHHLTVNLAYTGKAALELTQASGQASHTIDSFLRRIEHGRDLADLLNLSPNSPQRTQIVIKVDEASLVGGRQAAKILAAVQELREQGYQAKLSLVGDCKQMQSIQASPFFRHATDLARDGCGDYSVMKEITRQRDQNLLQVAKVLNRDRDRWGLGTNATDALKMLRQQDRVVEIADHGELVRAVVERYLAEAAKPSPGPTLAAAGRKQSVMVITPLNADRHLLNERIRSARDQAGELGPAVTAGVYTPVEQGPTVACYERGMIVIFSDGGRRTQQGTVEGIDATRNTVDLSFQGKGKTATISAPELAQNATLYKREERAFAVGDQVVFTRNVRGGSISSPRPEKTARVNNGERGSITALAISGDSTRITVCLTTGREVNVELASFGPQHLDHGYAVTTPKGQGETVDCVVAYNEVKALAYDGEALRKMAGAPIPEQRLKDWNSQLTEIEKRYRGEVRIGNHLGRTGFTIITDLEGRNPLKGVAVTFFNGESVMGDAGLRAQMREAGMHWNGTSWVTPLTNGRAASLMSRHPLHDPTYLCHLKESLAHDLPPAKGDPPRVTERNFLSAIDIEHERAKFGRATYNSFNVSITRARYEAVIYTNSIPGLQKAVKTVDEKTTVIGQERHKARASAPEKGVTSHQAPTLKPTPPVPLPSQPHLRLPKRGPELELERG